MFEIRLDDLSGEQIRALVREHVQAMYRVSPAECVHALSVDSLRVDGILVWSIWDADVLAGCGGFKRLDDQHAELKSMRTASTYLRKGVASTLLLHLVAQCRQRGYRRISLETGTQDYFEPARRLYARHGFVACGAFDSYIDNPYSYFMTCVL